MVDSAMVAYEQALSLLSMEDHRLKQLAEQLTPSQWSHSTNCPGWRIHDIFAHLARGVESYIGQVSRGMKGDLRVLSDAERARLNTHFTACSDDEMLRIFPECANQFQEFFGGFTETDCEVVSGRHRLFGIKSARWYVLQRLAEVAFHSWDIRHSLGLDETFAPQVGNVLLPMLIQDNIPCVAHSARPFVLSVNGLTIALPPGDIASPDPDLSLTGEAAAICLLLYGRSQSGVTATGDVSLLTTFSGF